MTLFSVFRGTETEVNARSIIDGQMLFTTDLGTKNKIYADVGTSRKLLGVGQEAIDEINNSLSDINSELASKANQTSLNETNATVALKADKSEVTNVMIPKGTLAYASLPTTGNTIGWYYNVRS